MANLTFLPAEAHREISRYLNANDCKSISQANPSLRGCYSSFSFENILVWDRGARYRNILLKEPAVSAIGNRRHRIVPISALIYPTKYAWFNNQSVRRLLFPVEMFNYNPSTKNFTAQDYGSLNHFEILFLPEGNPQSFPLYKELWETLLKPKNLLYGISRINVDTTIKWNSIFHFNTMTSANTLSVAFGGTTTIDERSMARNFKRFNRCLTPEHIRKVTIGGFETDRLISALMRNIQLWPNVEEIHLEQHWRYQPELGSVSVQGSLLELSSMVFPKVKLFELCLHTDISFIGSVEAVDMLPVKLPQVTHISAYATRDLADTFSVITVPNLRKFEVKIEPSTTDRQILLGGNVMSCVTQLSITFAPYHSTLFVRAMPHFINVKYLTISPKGLQKNRGVSRKYIKIVRDRYLKLLEDKKIKASMSTQEIFSRAMLDTLIVRDLQQGILDYARDECSMDLTIVDILIGIVLEPLETLEILEEANTIVVEQDSLIQACIYELVFVNIECYFHKLEYLVLNSPEEFLPISYALQHMLYTACANKNSSFQQMLIHSMIPEPKLNQPRDYAFWQLPVHEHRVSQYPGSVYPLNQDLPQSLSSSVLHTLYDTRKNYAAPLNSFPYPPSDCQVLNKHEIFDTEYMFLFEDFGCNDFCGWL